MKICSSKKSIRSEALLRERKVAKRPNLPFDLRCPLESKPRSFDAYMPSQEVRRPTYVKRDLTVNLSSKPSRPQSAVVKKSSFAVKSEISLENRGSLKPTRPRSAVVHKETAYSYLKREGYQHLQRFL